MVPELRKQYNEQFTGQKYDAYIRDLENVFPGQLDFRVAETPVFVPRAFRDKMLAACESILDVAMSSGYHEQSEKAIPPQLRVPGDEGQPECIAFDFGVCLGASGELEPQLIEMQGFPSLLAWQVLLPEIHARHFFKPQGYSPYLSGYDRDSYVNLLRKIIIGDAATEEVILLEIFPEKQKTRVDFSATRALLGIETVCLTSLEQEGNRLYYHKNGRKVQIRRIYNRVIFDDLYQQPAEVREKGKIFQQELDLTWIPHPNWFYRLSKFTLPFIRHPYVPETHFLDKENIPPDPENHVVKPLFSFAGQGVIIDVTKDAIQAIPDPQNWIIQRKVPYAEAIVTPSDPAKAEIRIFYLWEQGKYRPVAANNLARLSKGKMIGVRYNKDKVWVGGSFCYFEQ